jgi:hypothetical protein
VILEDPNRSVYEGPTMLISRIPSFVLWESTWIT